MKHLAKSFLVFVMAVLMLTSAACTGDKKPAKSEQQQQQSQQKQEALTKADQGSLTKANSEDVDVDGDGLGDSVSADAKCLNISLTAHGDYKIPYEAKGKNLAKRDYKITCWDIDNDDADEMIILFDMDGKGTWRLVVYEVGDEARRVVYTDGYNCSLFWHDEKLCSTVDEAFYEILSYDDVCDLYKECYGSKKGKKMIKKFEKVRLVKGNGVSDFELATMKKGRKAIVMRQCAMGPTGQDDDILGDNLITISVVSDEICFMNWEFDFAENMQTAKKK